MINHVDFYKPEDFVPLIGRRDVGPEALACFIANRKLLNEGVRVMAPYNSAENPRLWWTECVPVGMDVTHEGILICQKEVEHEELEEDSIFCPEGECLGQTIKEVAYMQGGAINQKIRLNKFCPECGKSLLRQKEDAP